MAITVGDILKLPSLAESTIISGLSGLNREVRTASVGEALDIARWIKGGEFIMSSLCLVHISEEKTCAWVRQIIESGASALGIRTATLGKSIPQVIIQLGDQNSFPIIELSENTDPTQVCEEIFGLTTHTKYQKLEKIVEYGHALTAAAIKGSAQGFVNSLAELLGNPVLIETQNLHFRVASQSTHAADQKALMARRTEQCIAEIRHKADHIQNLDDEHHAIFHSLEVNGAHCEQISLPISKVGRLFGFLSIIQNNRCLDAMDHELLGIARSIACLLAQQHAGFVSEEETRNQLFAALIDGKRQDEARKNAHLYGFDYTSSLFCAVVQPSRKEEEHAGWNILDTVLADIVHELQLLDKNILVIRQYSRLVIFCHVPGTTRQAKQGKKNSGYQKAIDFIQKVMDGLDDAPELTIGIGRAGTGLNHVRLCYEEACSALRIADKFDLSPEHETGAVMYSGTRYYSLLDAILQDEAKARLFCKDVLGSLLEIDPKLQDEWLHTLEVYLFYGRNLSKVHRKTNLHRNTVKYRIEKMAQILNGNLLSVDFYICVWIALQIRKHLKNKEM